MRKNSSQFIQMKLIPWFGWTTIAVMLVLWAAITETGLVKPLYLPSPRRVIMAAKEMGAERILFHTLATAARSSIGLVLGTLLAITVGLAITTNRYLFSAAYGIIESWRPVSPVITLPLFSLWFGFSDVGRLLLVMAGVFLIVVTGVIESVRQIRPVYLRLAATLGANRRTAYRSIVLPAILPALVAHVRVASAAAIGLVVISEYLGAVWGWGSVLSIARVTFSTHTLVLGIFVLGAISYLFDWALRKLALYLMPWAEQSSEAIVESHPTN